MRKHEQNKYELGTKLMDEMLQMQRKSRQVESKSTVGKYES